MFTRQPFQQLEANDCIENFFENTGQGNYSVNISGTCMMIDNSGMSNSSDVKEDWESYADSDENTEVIYGVYLTWC